MEEITGITTKQGDMGDESLRRELLDEVEYDPLFGSKISARLYKHDNSAYDMWQRNKDGKIEKKVRATCYICDEMDKKKVPSINARNYQKRSKDLEKIEECIYILDNSWRRREQQQIESIEYRGDVVLRDYRTHEIIPASGMITQIEKSHLDTAYVYRERMRKCIRVRDQLKANIREYLIKQSSKSSGKSTRMTRSTQKGGKYKKQKTRRRKINK